MTLFAFSRGQACVYAELPPTLQPCAIAAMAPPADRLRTAGWSGLIYLLGTAALFAISALAPPPIRIPIHPTGPDRIVVFDPPFVPPSILQAPAAPLGQGGQGDASLPVPALVPVTNLDAPATTMPTVDRSGERPGPGHGTTLLANAPQAASNPGLSTAPRVHDFSMTGLEVVRKVEPSYPTLARLSRIQGTVVLLMTVDEAGLPTQVQVLEGHAALQDAAVRAARQWRFVPARLEGRPVVASFRLTLKFALR